ncbi:hypothetical protein T439DRAFT_347776 [Meredithblackwellia eburnea MCA 4105]
MPSSSPSTPSTSSENAAPVATERKVWTAEEDDRLREAVNKHGSARGKNSAWTTISSLVGGRTNKDCRKRWFHSLDPAVKKGTWSPEEDASLLRLHAEMGPQWKEIALRIPGRKDDQVSKRWRDVLDPSLSARSEWTPNEDAMLLALFDQVGPRWATIAEKLPGRSALHCRNRYRKYSPKLGEAAKRKGKGREVVGQPPRSVGNTLAPPFDINQFCSSLAMFSPTPTGPLSPSMLPATSEISQPPPPPAPTQALPLDPSQIFQDFSTPLELDAEMAVDPLLGVTDALDNQAIFDWLPGLLADSTVLLPQPLPASNTPHTHLVMCTACHGTGLVAPLVPPAQSL